MSIILTRVDWTGKESDGSSVTQSFTDVEKITLQKESDAKANKGTIVLKNVPTRFVTGFSQPLHNHVQDTNNIAFNEGDVVKIYVKICDSQYEAIDTSTGSADLIMTGEVAEINVRLEESSSKITLKIVDKTYVMLSSLYTRTYRSSDAINAPEIIQDVIRNISNNVESDVLSYDASGNLVTNGIYGIDARLVSAGGFIEDTRQNGSNFPDLSMAKIYKASYEWVKDLSSVDSTNDFSGSDDEDAPTQNRNMIFYVDELNRFHWFYPRDAATTTLNGSITDSATSIVLTDASDFPSTGDIFIDAERISYTGKSTNTLTGCTRGENNTIAASHSDGAIVKNAITIVEGDTSSGHFLLPGSNLTKKTFDVINFVIFNCGNDLKGNGITQYFFDRSTKSKTLKDTYKAYTEIAKDLIEDEIRAGNLILDNTQTDFTYKSNFYKANTYGFTTTWGIDTSGFSDSDYNDAFRDECVKQGKARAKALTRKRGSPRWKGTLPLRFKRYTAGEIIEFTSTRAGINELSVRITKVNYNITKNGAFVDLQVEEDEAKIGT